MPKEVVKQLNECILASLDPGVDESKQAEVLTWVHHHLIAPVILEWDREFVGSGPSEEACSEMIKPSLDCIEIVRLILSGAVGIDDQLAFRFPVPPPQFEPAITCIAGDSLSPAGESLATALVAWLHKRLTHTAQRTRLHDESELAALLEWADAELIMYAVRAFELGPYFEKPPSFKGLPVEPAMIMAVARGYWSIDWVPDNPIFKVLSRPPGPATN